MSKEEPRFNVMLTRTEVESLLSVLQIRDNEGFDIDEDLIEHLERRLQQRDTHEAQEHWLNDDPETLVGI